MSCRAYLLPFACLFLRGRGKKGELVDEHGTGSVRVGFGTAKFVSFDFGGSPKCPYIPM